MTLFTQIAHPASSLFFSPRLYDFELKGDRRVTWLVSRSLFLSGAASSRTKKMQRTRPRQRQRLAACVLLVATAGPRASSWAVIDRWIHRTLHSSALPTLPLSISSIHSDWHGRLHARDTLISMSLWVGRASFPGPFIALSPSIVQQLWWAQSV